MYEVDRRIKKCDYVKYSIAETSTITITIGQIYINIPREGSVLSLIKNYLDLNIEVNKKPDNSRYADGYD